MPARTNFSSRRSSQASRQTAASPSGYQQEQGNAAAAGQASEQSQPGFLSRLFGGGSRDSAAKAAVAPEGEAAGAWASVAGGSLVLRKGAKGPAVEHLQTLLNQNGASVQVDGDFGAGTDRAVRAYQAAQGLGVDGAVGSGTAGKLSGGRAPARQPTAAAAQAEVSNAREAARGGASAERTEGRANSKGEKPKIAVSADSFVKFGLRREVMSTALTVFQSAWARGDTQKMTYTVIDYSMPSDQKRMFVIDLQSGKMLFHELVSHGSGSGGNTPTAFSNRSGSNQTSIGLSKTAETYHSSKFGGTALRIDGLEQGYNSNMRNRAVVMHQADYATPESIAQNAAAGDSRLGRSQGCPALDPRVAGQVINTVKNGTLIFSYYPDPDYMKDSKYVNG